MACRRLTSSFLSARRNPSFAPQHFNRRRLHTTPACSAVLETPVAAATPPPPAPRRRPIGAFRGTVFGFLLGATSAGVALYYYVIDDYRLSNQLLTEDLYALQGGVQRLEDYVKRVEGTVQELEKRLR